MPPRFIDPSFPEAAAEALTLRGTKPALCRSRSEEPGEALALVHRAGRSERIGKVRARALVHRSLAMDVAPVAYIVIRIGEQVELIALGDQAGTEITPEHHAATRLLAEQAAARLEFITKHRVSADFARGLLHRA